MSSEFATITRVGSFAVPYTYTLALRESWQPDTVSATFDGTGASGTFIPCLSVYTQDGKLLGRYPSSSVVAADTAEVTWAPFLVTDPFQPNTGGLWQAYTPTWTESSGTQPALGNGTITGLFFQIAKFVVARIELTAGTTTTFGNSTGVYRFTLPTTALVNTVSFGLASDCKSVASTDVFSWGTQDTTTTMAGYGIKSGGTIAQFINATQPTTWQATDVIRLACLYETV